MKRTPVKKKKNGVCLVDATPTHLGWVKWRLPAGVRQGNKIMQGKQLPRGSVRMFHISVGTLHEENQKGERFVTVVQRLSAGVEKGVRAPA